MDALSEFVFAPPPSLFLNVVTVVIPVVVAMLGLSEARGRHLQYSKFWNANSTPKSLEQFKLPSWLGMLLAYTPALLAGVVSLWFFPNEDRRTLLLKSALTLHFLKRDLEVLFVHKYSSKMVFDTAITISSSYFSSTALMIYTQHLSKALPEPSIDLKNIGIALFLIGIIGNFYHHFLLSKTRKQGETGYKIPQGGLFNTVICPHYLFEIIEYFGFALISQTFFSLSFAFGTAFYLAGRSSATKRCFLPSCRRTHRRPESPRSHPRKVIAKFDRVLHPKASNSRLTPNAQQRTCECFDLHRDIIPYNDAWSWQKDIVREKIALIDANEDCPDSLIVLQHPPVYTLGTNSTEEFLNFDPKDSPFSIYRTERGGEVTYHGPGQIVMYPIINLRNHKMDLHWYLRALEEVIIRVLSSTFSINANRVDGLTGVWAGNQKLAAIGIRVSKWITFHGLALNVTTDLSPFNLIVPCGIRNRQVGNIKELLLLLREAKNSIHFDKDSQLIDITFEALIHQFAQVFQVDIHQKTTPPPFLESLKQAPPSSPG